VPRYPAEAAKNRYTGQPPAVHALIERGQQKSRPPLFWGAALLKRFSLE